MPVEKRISSWLSSSVMGRGRLRSAPAPAFAAPDLLFVCAAEGASVSVFHSPQDGHWPNHFPVSFPQFVQ